MEFDGAENGLGMEFGGRGILREINKNDGGIKLSWTKALQCISVRRTLSIPGVQIPQSAIAITKMGNKPGKTRKSRASTGKITIDADDGQGNLMVHLPNKNASADRYYADKAGGG